MENSAPAKPVRVLIADDHLLFAEALTTLLGGYDEIEVVGRARDGNEAVGLVEELQPDVVLMDLSMPGVTGVEATRRVRERYPDTIVIVLTGSATAEAAQAAGEAGAGAFFSKDSTSLDVASAIIALAAFANRSPRSR